MSAHRRRHAAGAAVLASLAVAVLALLFAAYLRPANVLDWLSVTSWCG